jgi:hypothetical protein
MSVGRDLQDRAPRGGPDEGVRLVPSKDAPGSLEHLVPKSQPVRKGATPSGDSTHESRRPGYSRCFAPGSVFRPHRRIDRRADLKRAVPAHPIDREGGRDREVVPPRAPTSPGGTFGARDVRRRTADSPTAHHPRLELRCHILLDENARVTSTWKASLLDGRVRSLSDRGGRGWPAGFPR